ncbi:transferrin-binding protein-like solute binding protein [Neisseria montereyensis]|uniref:Transferrin-binding protein-like solute binding protein n=1 Tax=Neisseria montereyensis TaxID=2973938 RepID=A0ABT2FC47_9NEIS|nr:transferrin-binding protein-like solute binding protein [Neisseria montereyensis]MCS4533103.1 transferrin-binding protein-like solute binding protein [Neisseria montereyensis]
MKNMSAKNIVLTVICSAVLAACGGGGGGGGIGVSSDLVDNAIASKGVIDQIEALPAAESLKPEDIAALQNAINNYQKLSNEQKSLVPQASIDKLNSLIAASQAFNNNNNPSDNNSIGGADDIVDNNPLPALNEPSPAPTAFLSEAINGKAQQFNPNMQLRTVNNELLSNQSVLIREVAVDDLGEPTDLSKQDALGLLGLTFRDDFENPGNSPNSIERISKINSQETVSTGKENAADIDVRREVAYRQDKDKKVLDSKWDGIYAVRTTNGITIVLRDPSAIGWKYQTFAHYSDKDNNILDAYQTIGIETPSGAMPASGTATYSGLTTAYLANGGTSRQLTADVKAVADFAKKSLRFETSQSQLHDLQNNARVTTAAEDYNMKGLASWQANSNTFKGSANTVNGMSGELNGKFFGTSAAEIGGTYGLKDSNNTQQLIGGYGAKRQ